MLNETSNPLCHLEKGDPVVWSPNSRLPQPITKPTGRASPLKFFASASSSATTPRANMGSSIRSQKEWQASFLNDLRSNRPARPSGSRPMIADPARERPRSRTPIQQDKDIPLRTSSAMSRPIQKVEGSNSGVSDHRSASAMSHRPVGGEKQGSAWLTDGGGDGPLIEEAKEEEGPLSRVLDQSDDLAGGNCNNVIAPGAIYRESGQRWMEKQEARSLREALEDMDRREEKRLHEAAQDEASQLVWKHRNPNMPYRNPDAPYDYKSHLRKGSQGRSRIFERDRTPIPQHESRLPTRIPSSDHPTPAGGKDARLSHDSSLRQASDNHVDEMVSNNGHALWDSPQKRAYMGMSHPTAPANISGRRRSSGSKTRRASGGLFRNPNDQIYEEPDELKVEARTLTDHASGPLQAKTRNIISNPQQAAPLPFRSKTAPDSFSGKLSRSDIHKNPPSQSRNPSYLKNNISPDSPASINSNGLEGRSEGPIQKDGIEIRGDDIRAATSMRMRDRSPKLPSPTVVSDQRGRPIVSFDPDWKPREKEAGQDQNRSPPDGLYKPYQLRSTGSAPVIPTINLPEPLSPEPQEGCLNGCSEPVNPAILVSSDIPMISVEEVPAVKRPLPAANSAGRFKNLSKTNSDSATSGVKGSTRHWSQLSSSSSSRRATAQCYACALPISGRIVSAASHRFHPECFTCHQCSTALEHVAFYPEPDSARDARLARIQARTYPTAIITTDSPSASEETINDDGDGYDDSLRFYCHLDFHESFSPRCRTCKTPIEGEVVLACGAEWHVGHFFCAQCGDPFDAQTPFVEREGYAWCVECHANRFSARCRACRRPVVDLGVRALGGEWHEGCFSCEVCFFGGGRGKGRDMSSGGGVKKRESSFANLIFWGRKLGMWRPIPGRTVLHASSRARRRGKRRGDAGLCGV